MKVFSGFVSLILFVFCLTFAVVNRDPATVNLWPLDTSLKAPQSLLTLGSLLLGTIIGAGFVWLNMLPHRFTSRRLKREISLLQAKLEQLQNSVRPHHPADPHISMLTPPKPPRWSFRKPQL